jgi:hypothetical protein
VEEQEDLGCIRVSFGESKKVEVVVSYVKVLQTVSTPSREQSFMSSSHTLIPSSEKHGGTAELSSSASLSSIGNFSTALMGMSPL